VISSINKKRILPYIFLFGALPFFSGSICYGQNSTLKTLITTLEGQQNSIIADSLFQIGLSNYNNKELESSLDYLKEATKYYLKTENKKAAINSINLIGHVYLKQEVYDNALKNYLVALKLSRKINDASEIAKILNSIGRHSTHLKDYEKSLKNYKESLEIIELLDDNTERKAKSLNNIGIVYGYLGDIDKSLDYFNQSLPLRYELGNKEDLSILINNIGYAYILKKDYTKALEQFNISLKISEEINDTTGAAFVLLNIAELHIIQKNYSKAIPTLLKGLEFAQELTSIKQSNMLTSDSYEFLATAYEELGDASKSLFYYKKYNVTQKKLYQQEFENKTKNTALLNSIKLKEQKIKELNTENQIKELQLKSNYNFILSLITLLIIVSLFFIIFYFQKKNLIKANKNLVLKNLEIVENERILKNTVSEKINTIETVVKEELIPRKKYSNSPLSETQKEATLNKIILHIEKEKLFLKEDLTLIMLSNLINTNKSYISQIINEKFEKNFSSFVNEYRIKEARKLLSQEENWGITIESIANSVGFKSISAFNTAFKKYTGITPSYFINTIKSNVQES
tara:strand:+ start:446 stop:2164 length:1719 start_codon:yes stop_codon:yes gene_type:complete